MKVCLIGSYPPRQCGIATFSHNLLNGILTNNKKIESFVVALNDYDCEYNYPDEVEFTIRQNARHDYSKAAEFINANADVCVLQHEYGIFGGKDGVYLLSLLNKLRIPFITTFHTILKEPSFLQKIILQRIADSASKIIVMSRLAVKFLKNIYNVAGHKINLIEHGVPQIDVPKAIPEELMQFEGRRKLFTFGLLSRNKGIETVIKALPTVVKDHPDVVYVLLGKTHPGVLRSSGEEYRNYLKELALELGVEKHVCFIDKFVSDEELFSYLKSIDIYITPYLSEAQITSGTLSYAVGAGAAVVSTPYWHAKELLANDRGRLFPFKDDKALSNILGELLDDPFKMEYIRQKAFQYGQHIKWPLIGSKYLELAMAATEYAAESNDNRTVLVDDDEMPPFTLTHLKRLTDDTGIIQHAKYGIPNLKEGYCLDDNARAVVAVLMAYGQLHDNDALELLPRYLGYIHYMQKDDGMFRNFLHFNRNYLDETGSEDSFGRAIWALGYLIEHAPNNSYREFGHELFFKACPNFSSLKSLRGVANVIIGISYYLKLFPGDEGMLQVLISLTGRLTAAFEENDYGSWHWFESVLTYDNGILPLALLHSCEITGNEEVKNIGLRTLRFIEYKTLNKDYFAPVGNEGWHRKNDDKAVFDQQAIEAMAMILMYEQAHVVTKNADHIKKINTCFSWFLGNNELHVPLYDAETTGCCDGLECNGVNRNQGAESTLAFYISQLVAMKTMAWQYAPSTQSPPKQLINQERRFESATL